MAHSFTSALLCMSAMRVTVKSMSEFHTVALFFAESWTTPKPSSHGTDLLPG